MNPVQTRQPHIRSMTTLPSSAPAELDELRALAKPLQGRTVANG